MIDNIIIPSDIIVSSDAIQTRVSIVAHRINDFIQTEEKDGREIVLVGVLTGCLMFFSDVVRRLHTSPHLMIDFIKISSYKGTSSNKAPYIKQGMSVDVKDKTVIILDDILDTGYTLECVRKYIARKKPYCIKIGVFLNKIANREVHIIANWVGFAIPDNFVVGYGLDYEGKFRTLPHIINLPKIPD